MTTHWAKIARSQSGVLSRRQLLDAAVASHLVTGMLAREELEPICPGVYRVRGAPEIHRSQLWAAVLATGGVIGHASAAHCWGMLSEAPPQVHIVLDQSARRKAPEGIRLHRTLLPGSTARFRDGLPVTTRAQSLLDHLPTMGMSEATTLLDRALQVDWITARELERHIATQPGRTGNARLRRLAAKVGDHAAAESERRLHRLLRQANIYGWQANVRVRAGSVTAVGDVVFHAERLIIEVDGMAHHIAPERFQGDRARQNALQTHGWLVLRFTWAQITEQPQWVIAVIRRGLAQRLEA